MGKVETFLVSVAVVVFLFGTMAGASFRTIAEMRQPQGHVIAARIVQMSLEELGAQNI